MTTQPNTGPNRMRLWADYIEQNVKHHLLPLAVKNPDTLRELAAQWEADLSARDHAVDLAGINAEAANELERRAERAEAALEQVQNALLVRDHQYQATKTALEQARALANELQNYAKDKEVEMPVMMAAVVGTMRGIGDRLAAALVAASGGAA